MSETQTTDLDPAAQGLPDGEQATNNNEPERQEPEQKQPEDPEWMRRRIDRFTKQRAIVERDRDTAMTERDQARAEAAALRAKYEPQNDNRNQPAPRTEEQVRSDERQRVSAQQDAEQFNARSNDVAAKAVSTYGQQGFQAAHANWHRAGLDLNDKAHATLLRDIVSLPDAEHIYHHIGTDPDLASRLLDMNERDAYAEVRQIARERPWTQTGQGQQEVAPPTGQPQVSNAPRPAARQPGPARTSSRTVYDRDLPMDQFIAMRNKKS